MGVCVDTAWSTLQFYFYTCSYCTLLVRTIYVYEVLSIFKIQVLKAGFDEKWKLLARILLAVASIQKHPRILPSDPTKPSHGHAHIMSDFKSTRSILAEVEKLFLRDDDIQDIDDVQKMAAEMHSHHATKTRSAKELIKRMHAIAAVVVVIRVGWVFHMCSCM